MRLRAIIIILTIISLFVSLAGGYVFYDSLKKTALKNSHRKAEEFTRRISSQIDLIISERQNIAKGLARHKELSEFLRNRNAQSLSYLNSILDLFQQSWGVSVSYLMDESGHTIASSNRNSPVSFVGKNYAFRPYFIEAMDGKPSVFLALGVTSGRRGLYFSHPVYVDGESRPLGVAVIKSSVTELEDEIEQTYEGVMSIIDSHGVIFISSRQDWLFRTLWQVSESEQREIMKTRQFGTGPWKWTGVMKKGESDAVDREGNEYNVHTSNIVMPQGWKTVFLHSYDKALLNISGPVLKIAGYIIIAFGIVISLSVIILYRKANEDLRARKMLEDKLREMSITDELTQLYNRRGFYSLASHQYYASCRNRNKICLFYDDIDGLKRINDTLGHEEGDRAIQDIAQLLRSVFRKSDIIGRLGGDEFAVLMSCSEADQITYVQKRLSNSIDKLNERENRSYNLGISIGQVVYDPDSPMEFDEFVHNADDLMYRQKRNKSGKDIRNNN